MILGAPHSRFNSSELLLTQVMAHPFICLGCRCSNPWNPLFLSRLQAQNCASGLGWDSFGTHFLASTSERGSPLGWDVGCDLGLGVPGSNQIPLQGVKIWAQRRCWL